MTAATKAIQQKEREKQDSIIKAEQDKAIGDIPFHIKKKTFDRLSENFLAKHKLAESEFYKQATTFSYKIGGYGFWRLDGWFHHDSLYSIELMGAGVDYDEYDRVMPDQYKALKDLLVEKYGDPDIVDGLPSWTSLDKGYYKRCDAWMIGNKTIEIQVSCSGTRYALDLAVYKPAIQQRVKQEEQNKAAKETKKGSTEL